MYKMNQKVVVPRDWTNKTHVCYGWIYGIEKIQNGYYLGTRGMKEFKSRFTRNKYKVIYERNDKIYEEWFLDTELNKYNKV